MAILRLRPSQVKEKPDRFTPDRPVVVRAPLGEWLDAMSTPLMLLGLGDSLVIGRIKKSDNWNAQGLEGSGEVRTSWSRAYVLVAKAGERRATVVIGGAA